MFDRLPLGRHALAITLHGELLQKIGQMSEFLSVRQHDMGIRAQIVGLPYLEQRHDHWQVGIGRRGCRVLVQSTRTFEEPLKWRPAQPQSDTDADR